MLPQLSPITVKLLPLQLLRKVVTFDLIVLSFESIRVAYTVAAPNVTSPQK